MLLPNPTNTACFLLLQRNKCATTEHCARLLKYVTMSMLPMLINAACLLFASCSARSVSREAPRAKAASPSLQRACLATPSSTSLTHHRCVCMFAHVCVHVRTYARLDLCHCLAHQTHTYFSTREINVCLYLLHKSVLTFHVGQRKQFIFTHALFMCVCAP